jgi:hypothetical protein
MRLVRDIVVILALGLVGAACVVWFVIPGEPTATKELQADRDPVPPHRAIPVSVNRGPEVRDGFRGEVHPMLHGQTRLEVTAHWAPIGKGRGLHRMPAAAEAYSWFTRLQPAIPKKVYTAREFSAFLPETVGDVGQLWALDSEKMAEFLKQFHPRPLMQQVASGRRSGPDGAFAILRAVSPSHLDIAFRIHAEFYLTPSDWDPKRPIDAWYTPAYFTGRVVVDKQSGTVDFFRLALATEKALNVHLTVDPTRMGVGVQGHDIVRVDRMELLGGDGGLVEKISWASVLTNAEAQRRLAKVFYKAHEIDWLPYDQVLTQARSKNRPIFAIVSWGATDDQSC